MAKHVRPTPTARKLSRAVTVPVVLAVTVAGIAAPAFAGKPGGSTGGTVTCVANPNPVAWNTDYDVVTSGLGASVTVNVLVSDSVGTSSWLATSDANGVAVVRPHGNFRGTATAKVQKSTRHGWTQLTTCSLEVV
ncbi:MAG: hypothetical protein M3P04_13160 [Actinomycetota bacterium]|nr:hypothetical protein [Actinomycetota bacterium]